MKQYKLKKNQPAFEVVDGPLAGHKYTHGMTYTEIPTGEAHRFSVRANSRSPQQKKGGNNK